MRIARADDARGHRAAADLFLAYQAEFADVLGPQDLRAEALWIAEDYAPPNGMLVAWSGDQALGCGGWKELDHDTCELKRMYVAPDARGRGVGRALANAILDGARQAGFTTVKLDTSPQLGAAVALYRDLGFVEGERYWDTPVPCPVFMERRL